MIHVDLIQVEQVILNLFRNGIDATMRGIGKASLEDLTPDDLVVPRDFFVTSG